MVEKREIKQVCSKTIISDTCTLENIEQLQFAIDNEAEQNSLKILNSSVFKIVPAYDSKYLKKLNNIIKNEDDSENHKFLFSKFEQECKENQEQNTKLHNISVHYGDNIQLYHESSNQYLCFEQLHKNSFQKPLPVDLVEQSIFILSFAEYPSENTHFRLENTSEKKASNDEILNNSD